MDCVQIQNVTTETSEMNQRLQQEIKTRKVAILYQHANAVIIGMIVVSLFVTSFIYFNLWPENQPLEILAIWQIMFLLVSVIRLYGVTLYKNATIGPEQMNYWLYAYLSGIVVSGCLWGVLFLYLAGFLDETNTNFMIFFMEGMISAAVAAYATSFIAFMITSSTIMCPVIIFFLLDQAPLNNYMGYMLIFFLVFLLLISRQLNRTIEGYLASEYNVSRLQREKNYAAMINRELEEEILKRIDTEGKLKEEIIKAEALADKLITISSKDGLTGLNNRRRFDEYLEKEWKRSARTSNQISLILCDIDAYKAYNDTYGHLAGDDCLKKVARVLEHYTRRASDMAARYGGEEFVLLLPETSLVNATRIAEDIRLSIEELAEPHSASPISDHVTASMGVATIIPTRHQTPDTLIKLADDAMYAAKDGGRNRVVAINSEGKYENILMET